MWSRRGKSERVLVTGCLGQIGLCLVRALRQQYGRDNVIASDVRTPNKQFYSEGPFCYADVLNYNTLAKIVIDGGVTSMVHYGCVPSAAAEINPKDAMEIHIEGTKNVLELCRSQELKVVVPSSMAVYSPESGDRITTEDAIKVPSTIYGIGKHFQESIGEYYHRRFGLDYRGLRYPGIVSALATGFELHYQPTVDDYPVMAFLNLKKGIRSHKVGIAPDLKIPMLYVDDCVSATMALFNANEKQLTRRVYNVEGMSISPQEFEEGVKRLVPDFHFEYERDWRQEIALTWPRVVDGPAFNVDMKWKRQFDVHKTVLAMAHDVGLVDSALL